MREQKDFINIVRNVLKQWLIILLVSIIFAMGTGIVVSHVYKPTYQTKALLAAYMKEGWGTASGNSYKASETAQTFQEIIDSNLLQKRISEKLGVASLKGNIRCENITNTNLINLYVEADTPYDAMTTIHGVLENYNEVSDNLFSSPVIQIIEEPEVPTTAENRYNETKLLLEAFVLAFGGMLAFFFAFFYFRDDIKNEREIEEKLDAKLFGIIYHESKKKGFRLFHARKMQGILVNNPVTSFGYIETFQKICMKLEYMTKKSNAKTILVTSVQENEGKSTISTNLAIMLANRGKRVMLVDCDLRKPATYKMFHLDYPDEKKQFGAVLEGKVKVADAILNAPRVSRLYLLAGNKSYRNASTLLGSSRARKMFEFLAKKVDYVILDTPPLFLASDAEGLMQIADAGLLIVRQNYSKVKDLNDAVDIFKSADCELLGCILNDVETNNVSATFTKTDNYYYRYGYGYGKNRYGNTRYSKVNYRKTKSETEMENED